MREGNESHSQAIKILAIATGVSFLAGLLYIWSVLSKGLMNEFHWTSSQASLPYTVSTVSFVITMAIFGKVQDAKGPRICATLGGLFIGLGLILSGLTTDPVVLVFTFGIITGAGVGMATISTNPPALKWFSPSKKGLITGIVFGGIALSSMFYSPIINYTLSKFGVSKSFIFMGIGIGLVMIILAQFLVNPPVGYTVQKKTTVASKINTVKVLDANWKELFKSVHFYKLWIMFAFSSTTGLMIYGHAANIAKTQVSWEGGYLLVILLAFFNLIGRLSGGIISDRIGRINLLRIVFVFQAVNMLLMSNYKSIILLCMGVGIAGLCYGASFVAFPAVTADLYGMKYYGANYGLLFTAWGMGGVIGPMTAAKILDYTQSYNTAYLVACILLMIAFIIALTFKREQVSQ